MRYLHRPDHTPRLNSPLTTTFFQPPPRQHSGGKKEMSYRSLIWWPRRGRLLLRPERRILARRSTDARRRFHFRPIGRDRVSPLNLKVVSTRELGGTEKGRALTTLIYWLLRRVGTHVCAPLMDDIHV